MSSQTESPTTIPTSQAEIEPIIKSVSVPVVIKKDQWKRNILLCQVDDPKLNLVGNTGAVGRIKTDASSIQLDIKGRQYTGAIMSGPTVMLLNLAPPVGQQKDYKYKEVARAEMVTNEFCHLTLEKDVLGSMAGDYSYGNGGDDRSDDESIVTVKEEKSKGVAAKKNPVISQVTNRKRKSVGKKGGSRKKRK